MASWYDRGAGVEICVHVWSTQDNTPHWRSLFVLCLLLTLGGLMHSQDQRADEAHESEVYTPSALCWQGSCALSEYRDNLIVSNLNITLWFEAEYKSLWQISIQGVGAEEAGILIMVAGWWGKFQSINLTCTSSHASFKQ